MKKDLFRSFKANDFKRQKIVHNKIPREAMRLKKKNVLSDLT